MKKMVRNGTVAGVIVLGGAGVWFFGPGAGGDERSDAPIALATVERRDLDVAVEAAGVVEPIRIVEVKSKASGEVLKVEVETGDRVEEDTLLAEIDPRDVQNALAQAEAEVESARVRLSTTEAHRGRMEKLRGSSVVTQQEYESAIQAAAEAKASAVRAETDLQLARERRRDVIIRAPIDGTIIERTVEPGIIIASATSNVSGGTTLFKMADLSEMQVRAKVDEMDVGQIRSGQSARVTVEAFPGRVFRGTILKIEPQAVVEQNVTMFPVLVRLDNRAGLLRPGMNAEVSIEVATREDVAVVPNTAIVSLREARAAAEALGLDGDAMRAALRGGPRGRDAASGAAAKEESLVAGSGGAIGRTRDAEGRAGDGAGGRPSVVAHNGQPSGERMASDAAVERGRRSGAPASEAPGIGGGAAPQTRPGVVFVQGPAGPEPRRVLLGLSDWEYTEVVHGLEPGEPVVLVSVAQMQKRQQEMTDRVRQRSRGPMGR